MSKRMFLIVSPFLAIVAIGLLLSACGGSSVHVTAKNATLVSIGVTPANPNLPQGLTGQFTATGTYSDNSTQDLTAQVAWSSSNTGVATIDSAGLATSVAAGTTTITATLGLVSGNTTLTVTNATLSSIAVTPTNPSIANGTTRQFTATGTYSDFTTQDLTTQVAWSSSAAGVATISNAGGSQGLATSVAAGTTTITATLGGVSGSTTLTVTAAILSTITVTPTTPSIANGTTRQFTATGTYSDSTTQDLTTQVAWSSSAAGVAMISNASGSKGLATSVAAGGPITITATLGSVSCTTTNTCATLTVTSATLVSIAVTPTNPGLPLGLTQQFTATGTFSDSTTQDLTTQVTWSSSSTAVATISNAGGSQGLATSVAAGGPITITATLGGVSGNTTLTVTAATLTSIAVTPANPSLPLGLTRQFTATGTFSDSTMQDLTTQVTWSSSSPGMATISNASGSKGLATSVAAGTTIITATLGSVSGNTTLTVNAVTLVSITVTPANPTLTKGTTQQFTATGHYSDF